MRRWEEADREEADSGLQGRIYFFRILIVAIFGLLLYRVFWLQQVEVANLRADAIDNRVALLLLDSPRGVIFDRNGVELATNEPNFNVTITPAFLPSDEQERLAVFERLSLLTGVPVTNTVQQEILADQADPDLVEQYSRLASIYGVSQQETLDLSGLVPELPESIIEIYDTFSFAQYLPATVKSGVTITEAQIIEQESVFLPGVRVIPEPVRSYPTGESTAHIIGFMGPLPSEAWLDLGYERDDRVGLSGIELWLEPILRGEKGSRQIEVDWTGRETQQIGTTIPSTPGYNLHLTLDMDLQLKTIEILEKWMQARREFPDVDFYSGIREFREVELGAIVVMNPQTGEILAMANIPSFDNNRFATEIPVEYYLGLLRDEYEPFLNHAIAGQYPPGSTFKVITVAAALQEGIVSPNRLLDTPGTIQIANQFAPNDPGRAQEFVCWISLPPNFGDHGAMNAYTGLSQSCDIYMYKIAGGFQSETENVPGLGIDRLRDYALQFGLGRVQGLELPLEVAGVMPNRQWKQTNYGSPWSTGDDYNASIGQGYVLSTPMQVAQMAAVVANGGFLYKPSIVHHLTDAEGNYYVLDEDLNPIPAEAAGASFDEEGNIQFLPRVLNALEVDREFIQVVAEGMRQTNDDTGTASSYVQWFDEFGIETAGKTGTSEFCDNISQIKGWCTEEIILAGEILPTHSWYVAYGPYEDAEIVVAGFLYNGGEGSQWATPMVREVMEYYFQIGQYAPGNEVAQPTQASAP